MDGSGDAGRRVLLAPRVLPIVRMDSVENMARYVRSVRRSDEQRRRVHVRFRYVGRGPVYQGQSRWNRFSDMD